MLGCLVGSALKEPISPPPRWVPPAGDKQKTVEADLDDDAPLGGHHFPGMYVPVLKVLPSKWLLFVVEQQCLIQMQSHPDFGALVTYPQEPYASIS